MNKPLSPLEKARGLVTEEVRAFLSSMVRDGTAETSIAPRPHIEAFRHRLHRFRRYSLDGLANASPSEADSFRHWMADTIHPSLTKQILELMLFRPLPWPPGSDPKAPTFTLLGLIRRPLMALTPNGASQEDLDIIAASKGDAAKKESTP